MEGERERERVDTDNTFLFHQGLCAHTHTHAASLSYHLCGLRGFTIPLYLYFSLCLDASSNSCDGDDDNNNINSDIIDNALNFEEAIRRCMDLAAFDNNLQPNYESWPIVFAR